MGFGASKIDYKERNFTEQPLEEEEIDILLKALPEENVIDSVDAEGREKILRAMSDQKVFNIKGDGIFDYYINNKREIIKRCMKGHINRDGTPCPDEKFIRMIENIPDLVQGPLGEKQTEWNTEKNNLQSKYDTLNTQNTDLQSQYDTLNEERKQNLDTLALDSFLANPEMYNKMLKEKMSQKTLDIFTKDGDINIDVKETIEFKQFSRYFEMAYESKKSVLPQLVESLKKGSPSGLEQFKTKDFANIIIGIGNLMIIYFFYVYLMMKIIPQYNSIDKKRVPNETVYNSFSEFFNELGIGEQQFEYVLKFIAFNTFKKFMDYESKNDAKGLDIFLKDSLKILEEFIGKEYVNSLANFDVFPAEEKTFDYVHANVGKPDMSVSQCDCEDYIESKGYSFSSIDYKGAASGCLIYKDPNDKAGFYNKASTEGLCSSESVDCVQKKPDVKNFVTTSLGNPDMSVSEFECEQYAKSIGKELRTDLTNRLGGCSVGYDTPNSRNKIGMVYYGSKSNNNTCGSKFSSYISDCVKKKPKVDHFQKFTVGKPDLSVSEFECEQYAKSISADSIDLNYNSSSAPKGCFWRKANNSVGFNPSTNTTGKCSDEFQCTLKPIDTSKFRRNTNNKKNFRTVSEQQCQAYSRSTNRSFTSGDFGVADPSGCYSTQNGIFFNTSTSTESKCSGPYKCVHRPWKEEDYTIVSSGKPLSKYKEVSSGKPDLSASEEECEAYAKSINKWGGSGKFNDTVPGCYRYKNPSNPTHDMDIFFNKDDNNTLCSNRDNCLQKNPRYLDEEDCNRYSNTGGKGYTEGMLNKNETQLESFPKGCTRKDNLVGYSPSVNSPALCGHNGYNCIYKALTKEDFKTVSSGKPLSFYKDVSSGKPDLSVSETECNSSFPSATYTDKPSGCIKYGSNIRWNKHTNTNSCSSSTPCVQKDPNNVSEQQCKAYAKLSGTKGYGTTKWDSYPNGCFDNTTGGIYFNKGTADCATDRLCIQLK